MVDVMSELRSSATCNMDRLRLVGLEEGSLAELLWLLLDPSDGVTDTVGRLNMVGLKSASITDSVSVRDAETPRNEIEREEVLEEVAEEGVRVKVGLFRSEGGNKGFSLGGFTSFRPIIK